MKKILFLFLAGALMAAGSYTATAEKNKEGKVPGQYIVVFKDGVDVDKTAGDLVKNHGLGHLFTYKTALKGFAAKIPAEKFLKVKNDPRVRYVTEDRYVSIDAKPVKVPPTQPAETFPTGIRRIGADILTTNEEEGVGVAVIDTGIDLDHPDLKVNIMPGVNYVLGATSADDDNGHGTHVAGTIAAIDNEIGVVGVASKAKLYPVKVLDRKGSGYWSTVIKGIDWVTAANASSKKIKVANMSLGGSGSSDKNCGYTNNDPLHQAICKSRDAGITYVVAAGNESDDAANHVPAAYDDAVITVSALADFDGIANGDAFASFSNFNSSISTIVDFGAPGVNILSTWKGGTYNTISGTSMASPHVAGVAALYLSKNPEAKFEVVKEGLLKVSEGAGTGHISTLLHPEPVVLANEF